MSDEVKNNDNEIKEEVKSEAKEEVKAEAKEESKVDSVVNSIKGRFSSLISKATAIGNTVVDTVIEQAEKGKEAVGDKIRERDANEIYRKLGKKVARLAKRGEIELPECCKQQLDDLDELYADGSAVRDDDDDDKDKECCSKDGEVCECSKDEK